MIPVKCVVTSALIGLNGLLVEKLIRGLEPFSLLLPLLTVIELKALSRLFQTVTQCRQQANACSPFTVSHKKKALFTCAFFH